MNSVNPTTGDRLRPVFAAIRAATELEQGHTGNGTAGSPPAPPFVTISRQAGAGGRSVAKRLVEGLNALAPADLPWTSWDQELVSKVASENNLPEDAVAALEDRRPSWLQEALGSLALTDDGSRVDEFRVFRRTAVAVRALAEMGRVVIVGRGGVFLTRGIPGGVHLRLVAPLEFRVARVAERFNLPPEEAAERVEMIDHSRNAFYRRYWPDHPLAPETFTLTINTALVSDDRLVSCVVPLILPAATTGREGELRTRAPSKAVES